MTNLGIVIIVISALGYLSNMLNWRFLNYRLTHFLYYIGALVHETSHAVLCVLTGAKIEEFSVFSDQPRVVHRHSKIPFLGELLISAAPIVGGLLFLFLVNHYLLGNYFVVPRGFVDPFTLLRQVDLLQWQSWVMILLFFNVGAMLGPSTQDLKNVWPLLIILLFIHSELLADIGFLAISLIVVDLILQALTITALSVINYGMLG